MHVKLQLCNESCGGFDLRGTNPRSIVALESQLEEESWSVEAASLSESQWSQ